MAMAERHRSFRLLWFEWWRGWISDHRDSCLIVATLLVVVLLWPQYLPLVVTGVSLTAGVLLCQKYLSPDLLLPNLLHRYERPKQISEDEELTLLKKICPVCGNEKCSRHRPELNIVALQPWTNLRVPKKVDEALEEFFNLVLREHIYSWYRELSETDEAFVDEVRSSLRFLTAVLLRRILKCDLASVITCKIVRAAVKHLHFYLEIKRKKGRPGLDLQQALLDSYGDSLHCAVHSRRAELHYLKSLTERISPFILPPHALHCRSLCSLVRELLTGAIFLPLMDLLADPDIVNHILLIFLDKTKPPINREPPSPDVVILQDFAQPLAKKESCLNVSLTEILSSQQALLPFMHFMQSEASINVLQFYLSVEELNSKLLKPDLGSEELSELHQELRDMYRIYCDPVALDRIQFDPDIIEELQNICNGPPSGVIKLQTSTPLFRAYEHAYQLLETTFLPLFYQSDYYYQFLCGQRISTKLMRSDSNSSLTSKTNNNGGGARAGGRKDALSLSRIGSKIKGVFRVTTVDGKVDEDLDYCTDDIESEDEFTGYCSYSIQNDGLLRDLSAWRVTVPSLVAKPDPENLRKQVYSYLVEVRRVDVMEGDFEASQWTVERRYPEFYVLEQKLAEFHGDFEDNQLPAKKLVGTRTYEFLESRRLAFEMYLQKLLTRPKLRASQLLFNFLAREDEFTSSILPDINLGKMVKSGAMKLVKERGQHLEPFLQSLLTSVERPKPRPSRFTDPEPDSLSISSEKMANSIFENNASRSFTPASSHPHRQVASPVNILGIYDALIFLAHKVYGCPAWLHRVLMVGRMLAQSTITAYIDHYIRYKLHTVSREHRVVNIIHLIRDVLFFDNDPPRTDSDKLERKNAALAELKDFIPKIFVDAVGQEEFSEGTEVIFSLLQQPKLNKQLSYVLLDEALDELFPELNSSEEHQTPLYNHHTSQY